MATNRQPSRRHNEILEIPRMWKSERVGGYVLSGPRTRFPSSRKLSETRSGSLAYVLRDPEEGTFFSSAAEQPLRDVAGSRIDRDGRRDSLLPRGQFYEIPHGDIQPLSRNSIRDSLNGSRSQLSVRPKVVRAPPSRESRLGIYYSFKASVDNARRFERIALVRFDGVN